MIGGAGWEFADAVFERRFSAGRAAGRDVQSDESIAELAASVGLDGAEAAAAWASGRYEAELREGVTRSERDGCFGVPFVVHRGQRFWGNDKLPWVARSVRLARRRQQGRGGDDEEEGADVVRFIAKESLSKL